VDVIVAVIVAALVNRNDTLIVIQPGGPRAPARTAESDGS
jgi:hypothetical protein